MERSEGQYASRGNVARGIPKAPQYYAEWLGYEDSCACYAHREIIHAKRSITPDTALRLARFFGNSPEFWLNLQQMHDLSKAKLELARTIEREVEVFSAA